MENKTYEKLLRKVVEYGTNRFNYGMFCGTASASDRLDELNRESDDLLREISKLAYSLVSD